ncbi:MAG: hypothetical protein Q7T56_10595 [Nocardioidaceae bacterium]|nr:hypothetical protein [Nocardioidaceae bacterium]
MDARIDPSLMAEIEYRHDRARRFIENEQQAAVVRRARRLTRRARAR